MLTHPFQQESPMQRVSGDPGSASDNVGDRTQDAIAQAITVDTAKVKSHLDEVVRSTVEQTLNTLLDEEADRVAGRAGSYQRKLQTKAGQVTLTVPRLRKLPL